jgi:hypothetical protein
MNQHLSHPWNRPDPSTTFRRYLAAVRPQGQLLAVHHASPERMVQHDDFYSMTHQSKKKRIEDDPLPTDAGAKPIQLQRRRVWRACESCRQVDRALHLAFVPQQKLIAPIADVRKSSATAVSPLALSASRLDRNALGFKQRTEQL